MKILSLDTSLSRCGVAIIDGERILVCEKEDLERGHAERLAPMVERALVTASLRADDLDRIAVVVGPGGFTGVRVALSFARGLGSVLDVPVIGVTSLEALAFGAQAHSADGLVGVVIDARRGQVYAGAYEIPMTGGSLRLAPFVADPEEAAKRLSALQDGSLTIIGSGVSLVAPFENFIVSKESETIDPVCVAKLGGMAVSPRSRQMPAPVYLRPPDAKPPSPRARTAKP